MADQGNLPGVAIVLLCPEMGTDHHGGEAHCTLVYAGETNDVSLQQAVKMDNTVRAMSYVVPPFEVDVVGVDWFGTENDERVLLLADDSFLQNMRFQVVHWNRSEFTRYRPHVATAHAKVPSVAFPTIALWYGTKRIEYPLRGQPGRRVVTVRGPDDLGDEPGGN